MTVETGPGAGAATAAEREQCREETMSVLGCTRPEKLKMEGAKRKKKWKSMKKEWFKQSGFIISTTQR